MLGASTAALQYLAKKAWQKYHNEMWWQPKFQAKEIKDAMKLWNEKMEVLQEQGYNKKKLINAKKRSNKLKDLTYSKSQISPGHFSTADEVSSNIRCH